MTDRDSITRTRARAPGVVAQATSWRCMIGPAAPARTGDPALAAECTKDGCKPGLATWLSGADLSDATFGKAPSDSQPYSRIGENPPSGMRGGIEETSASFEARSAPRSYPTTCLLEGDHVGAAQRWGVWLQRHVRQVAIALIQYLIETDVRL